MSRSFWRAMLVLAAVAVVPACGGGGGGGGAPPDPQATVTTPGTIQSGQVTISYRLIDAQSDLCDILVEFSIDGGTTFGAATAGTGGDGTAALTASPDPGTSHTFVWNSLIDGVATSALNSTIQIRITPRNSVTGLAAVTGSFTVDNSGNTVPSASLTTPGGTQAGLVSVGYTLTDTQSNSCSIAVAYSTDGGLSWTAATDGPGGNGTSALASSPGGSAHVYVWNSFADGVATAASNASVRIRITPTDGSAGTPAGTGNFTVDNTAQTPGGSISGSYPRIGAASGKATAVATDGRSLFVAGNETLSGSNTGWRVEKRNLVDGALDGSWASSGVVTSDPSVGFDTLNEIFLDSQYFYVIGLEDTSPFNGTNNQGRIEKRNLSNGALVASFGTSGVVNFNPVTGHELRPAMAIDSTYLYVVAVGFTVLDEPYTILQKRRLSDGGLVDSFGTAGEVTDTAAGGLAVAISGGSLYVGAGGGSFADMQTQFQKRDATTGSLDASFGTGGRVTENLATGATDVAPKVTVSGGFLWGVVQVETGAGTKIYDIRIEKRALSDGALAASVTTGIQEREDMDTAIAVDSSSVWVMAAKTGGATDTLWRIEKRAVSNLALVAAWGSSGAVVIDPSVGQDNGYALALSGGVLYAVGGDSVSGDRWRIEARWK